MSNVISPFPYFGGKLRASSLVWERLGDVPNYVEPFFGSGAIMLARPHDPKIETINDLDNYVANFWRALQADPVAVAEAADWPVNEADLEARHAWLVTTGAARLAELMATPDGFDAKIAGWWVWGQCAWIGSGWCSGNGPWTVGENGWEKRNAGRGINRQLPHLGNAGQGINRQLPHLGNAGQGINRQLPNLRCAGQGINRQRQDITDYMLRLSIRLRGVRVCCGDWSRVLTPSPTHRLGMTGVVLDPPYSTEANRTADIYSTDSGDVAHAVREWAIENGKHPLMRIVLCGYEGEHDMPPEWECVEWKAMGGYSSASGDDTQGKLNKHRERLWFSPACIRPGLFSSPAPEAPCQEGSLP